MRPASLRVLHLARRARGGMRRHLCSLMGTRSEGVAAALARLALGRDGPLVCTWHRLPAPARARLRLVAHLGDLLLPPPDAWIAVSEEAARRLRARARQAPVAVVRNAVDFAFLRPPGRRAARRLLGFPAGPLVGWAGRLAPEEGPDIFLRAAALVAGVRADCAFGLAGDGPWAGRIARLERSLNLGGSLLRPGWVEDMPAFYASLDVFVLTSRSEGPPSGRCWFPC